MTKQIINVGSAEQSGDGESIRSAFIKVNQNFDELYEQTSGPTGSQGIQGIAGAQGAQGAGSGAQGIQGIAGSQGTQGLTGSQGIQGRQGITGAGTQGVQGMSGGRGVQGTQGISGSQGAQGRQGIQGLTGNTGGRGIQGLQGIQGLTGAGAQGIQGIQGRQGITGEGVQGITGAQGIQGIQGEIGPGGVGLYISDFGEGFSLTANDKIVTNKLYSTNLTEPNQHYRLELDTNGVLHLADQSTINGATLKSVAGNYAGITAGPIGKDEDSWMWVDSGGAFIATDYSTHEYTWTFDNSGNLSVPGDIQATTGNSIRISSGSNTGGTGAHIKLYGAGGEGGDNNTSLTSGDIDIVAGVDGGDEDDHDNGNLDMGNIRLKTSAYTGQPVNEWKFGWDGVLTLAGVPTPNFFGDQGTIQYQPSGWFPLQTVGTTINGTVGGTSVAAAFKFNKTLYEFDFTTLRVGVDIIMLDYADVGYPDPPGTKGYPATITVSIQDPDNQDLWIIGQNNAGVGLAEGTTLWLKYNDENINLNETWGFSSSRLNMPGNAKFSNGNYEWTFGTDGALNLPANGVIRNPNGIKRTNIVSGGDFVQLQWTTPQGAAEEDPNATTEQLNWLFVEQGGIYLETNVNGPGATHSWRFNTTGGLGFPDETVQTTAFPGFPDIVVTGETAPDTGILWFNTQEARIYIKYDEQWVDASPTVLVPPNTNPTLESVTFNDATVQTTAWSGSVSYNNVTDKPTFVGGGNASTWLTAG